ncbi:MAG TPA: diguanylate cyclase [Chloroflexota bacterium]|nr:diguanylate cyclase [Chloroflexota bacterium]
MRNRHKELFAHEREILDSVEVVLRDSDCPRQQLLDSCRTLLKSYEEILRQTEKIFRISDMTSAEIKRTEAKLKALLDNSNQGFLTIGRDLRVEKEYSCECNRILGDSISGLRLDELLAQRSEDCEPDLDLRLEALFAADSQEERQALSARLPSLLTISGNRVAIEYKFIANAFEANETKLMLILTDVTEKKEAEEQIRYLSYCDKLTGLHNRAYAESRLPDLLAPGNLPLGLILCDIDGLKVANDLFGHKTGDDLIKTVAGVLRLGARKDDIIARWGGDEFLFLLSNTDATQCQRICRRIDENCQSQESFPLIVRVSSGYATIDDCRTSFDDAFVRADAMMYANKQLTGENEKKGMLTGISKQVRHNNERLANRLDGFTARASGFLERLNGQANTVVSPQNLTVLWVLNNLPSIMGTAPISVETMSRIQLTMGEPWLSDSYSCLEARWDGLDSVDGPHGEEIPLISRVFSILNGFCSIMESGRSPAEAMESIRMESGKRYDPQLVEVLLGQNTPSPV